MTRISAAVLLALLLSLAGCATPGVWGDPDLSLRPYPFRSKGLVVVLPAGLHQGLVGDKAGKDAEQVKLEGAIIGKLNAKCRVYDLSHAQTAAPGERTLIFRRLGTGKEATVWVSFKVARHVLVEPYYSGAGFADYVTRNPRLKEEVELWKSEPTGVGGGLVATIAHHAELFAREWGSSLDLDAAPIDLRRPERKEGEKEHDGGFEGRWSW